MVHTRSGGRMEEADLFNERGDEDDVENKRISKVNTRIYISWNVFYK